jgi:hypothetical protein
VHAWMHSIWRQVTPVRRASGDCVIVITAIQLF